MPLAGTGAALGDKIALIITASDAPEEAKQRIKMMWEEIGIEIVNHFIEKTIVVVKPGIGVQVTPVTGQGSTNAPGTGNLS